MLHVSAIVSGHSDLGIFANEAHPSKGLSRSRESISLYTILDHTSSSGGSATLKSWLKSPLQDLEEIQYRQNMIGLFVDPDNKPYIHDLRRSLKSLGNLPKALRNFGNNTCRNVQDWNVNKCSTIHTWLTNYLLDNYEGALELSCALNHVIILLRQFMSNFVNIITTLEKCAGLERVRALRAKVRLLINQGVLVATVTYYRLWLCHPSMSWCSWVWWSMIPYDHRGCSFVSDWCPR